MEKLNPTSEASVLNFFGRCRPSRLRWSGSSMSLKRQSFDENDLGVVGRRMCLTASDRMTEGEWSRKDHHDENFPAGSNVNREWRHAFLGVLRNPSFVRCSPRASPWASPWALEPAQRDALAWKRAWGGYGGG